LQVQSKELLKSKLEIIGVAYGDEFKEIPLTGAKCSSNGVTIFSFVF